MFKISPVQDPALAENYAKLCGAKFEPTLFMYAMTDTETGSLMGITQFEITKDSGYIHDLKEIPDGNDFEAMFILGRQTMNFIDLCGPKKCYASVNSGDKKLLSAIGFKQDGDKLICDMTGMFDGSHCSGHSR